jgi:hypothetical protein
VEALQECLYLFFNCCGHLHIAQTLNILQFILLCDWDISAVWNQILDLELSEIVIVIRECLVNHIGDIMLCNPFHVFIELVVLLFHIVIGDRMTQDVFVKGRSEKRI